MLEKAKLFLQESQQEFKRVNWPTFAETRKLTLIVIGFSLGIAVFLGVLDLIFAEGLKVILGF